MNLKSEDAKLAFRSISILRKFPREIMSFLEKEFGTVRGPSDQDLEISVNDLDSKEFTKREKATNILLAHGDAIQAALTDQLKRNLSLECRQRIQMILARVEMAPLTAERLRLLRTLGLLEAIKTAEGVKLLRQFGQNNPHDWLGQEAIEAAKRAAQ